MHCGSFRRWRTREYGYELTVIFVVECQHMVVCVPRLTCRHLYAAFALHNIIQRWLVVWSFNICYGYDMVEAHIIPHISEKYNMHIDIERRGDEVCRFAPS